MSISDIGFDQHRRTPIRRRSRWARQWAGVGLVATCLIVFPANIRFTSDFGVVGIGMAEAIAQNRGNGNGNERSARPDRDVDRDVDRGGGRDRGNGGNDRDDNDNGGNSGNRGNGRATRGVSVSDPSGILGGRSIAPAVTRPAATVGRVPVGRDDQPGHAPTEAGTARTRAMVEIAKELGAIAPTPTERSPISGPVTQEMLDVAERAYVAAVQEAWEAHGFPWADPDVLRSLGELEALVSSLETIMASTIPGPVGRRGMTVAPDINNDGFVDINDLWDAHQR